MSAFEFLTILTKLVPTIMDDLLRYPPVQSVLKRENGEEFDAVLVENIGNTAVYAIAEHFNATTIGMTTIETQPAPAQALGNIVHPILHPSPTIALPRIRL